MNKERARYVKMSATSKTRYSVTNPSVLLHQALSRASPRASTTRRTVAVAPNRAAFKQSTINRESTPSPYYFFLLPLPFFAPFFAACRPARVRVVGQSRFALSSPPSLARPLARLPSRFAPAPARVSPRASAARLSKRARSARASTHLLRRDLFVARASPSSQRALRVRARARGDDGAAHERRARHRKHGVQRAERHRRESSSARASAAATATVDRLT